MSSMTRLPPTLRRLIQQRQCIAFVGAGFSMPVGMPGWSLLLDRLCTDLEEASVDSNIDVIIDEIRNAIGRRQLPLAASLLRQNFDGANLNRSVAKHFSMEVFFRSPQEMQKKILRRLRNLLVTPWSGIITTNYDAIIEHGLGKYTTGDYTQTSPDRENFGDILCSHNIDGRFLVKLHGSVSGAGYVISTEDYDRVYLNSPKVQTFLSAIMLRYRLMFIGCSLEDEILRIRRRLSVEFEGKIPAAYALMPNTAENNARRQWLADQAQIYTILYDVESENNRNHEQVDAFLETLGSTIDPLAGGTDVTIKGSSHAALLELPIDIRVSRIGSVNLSILKLIGGCEGGVIHAQLVDISWANQTTLGFALQGQTAEERIYRVLFLVSVGLIRISNEDEGKIAYSVETQVLNAIRRIMD